jgi:hypothetical protein
VCVYAGCQQVVHAGLAGCQSCGCCPCESSGTGAGDAEPGQAEAACCTSHYTDVNPHTLKGEFSETALIITCNAAALGCTATRACDHPCTKQAGLHSSMMLIKSVPRLS